MAARIATAAFVRALRCGDVTTMDEFVKQPHVQDSAVRAESWLAVQTRDVVRGAWFNDWQRLALAQQLARSVFGTTFQPQPVHTTSSTRTCPPDGCFPWFVTGDGSRELVAFASRDAAVDSTQWLLSSPFVQSTPLLVQWMVSALLYDGGYTANVQLLEVLFESAVFHELFSETDRAALLDHTTLAWIQASSCASGKRWYGHAEVARVLLVHGASLKTLQRAVLFESAGIDQFLVDNGAHVRGLDEVFCYCPFSLCVRHEYLQAMVDGGADPRGVDGDHTWHVVLSSGTIQSVKVLLDEWCVDVNARHRLGNTPLLDAVLSNSTFATRRLLTMGADANATDFHGRSALTSAAGHASPYLVRILLACGADPNHVDAYGNTALSLVAWERTPNARRARELLERYGAWR